MVCTRCGKGCDSCSTCDAPSPDEAVRKALYYFQMIVDHGSMKCPEFYEKYPEYDKEIQVRSTPYGGQMQIAKYAIRDLTPRKEGGR